MILQYLVVFQQSLFSGTITLSSGKSISKLEFFKNYTGSTKNLLEYYHKEGGGKQFFFKFDPESNQGAIIVIDSYSKSIVDAESRIITNITQQELQLFEKQSVYDE